MDEKLTAFVELESAIRGCRQLPRQAGENFRNSPDMKPSAPTVLITFALVCFALVQNTQAVDPPPDGGYPHDNTALGTTLSSVCRPARATQPSAEALYSNTGCRANTATGMQTLYSNTTGYYNTATGVNALVSTYNRLPAGCRSILTTPQGITRPPGIKPSNSIPAATTIPPMVLTPCSRIGTAQTTRLPVLRAL